MVIRHTFRWLSVGALSSTLMILGFTFGAIAQTEVSKEAVHHYTEGLRHLNQGELDAAEGELEEAVRLDPESVEALGSLALVYLKRGEKTRYREVLKRAAEVIARQAGPPALPKPSLVPMSPSSFDIAILIDTSGSTQAPSGVDIDGDGIVGRKSSTKVVISFFGRPPKLNTDSGDSILAAEILAAKKLISQLDPRTNRIAIISFAGDYLPGTGYRGKQTFLANPDTPDAFLEQPLTSNFQLAAEVLDQIERRGSFGDTNMAEGIQVAINDLTGGTGSGSTPRRRAQKVILLLTDGIPTFPVGSATISDSEDIRAAVSAAAVAGRFGIKVHTFALGKEALSEPYTVKEMARVTNGRFTPVADPGDIITVLPGIELIEHYDAAGNVVKGQGEKFTEEITIPLETNDPRYKEYVEAVKERILRAWRYPESAEPGLRGKMKLEFSIERDGSVSRVKVLKSSGYHVLDRGAEEAVRRASPFPPLPPKFNTNRFNIVSGFRYN